MDAEFEKYFLANVQKTESCWFWKKKCNPKKYSSITFNRKTQTAHRASYQLYKGNIPKGFFVCHHCDNPPCVNPQHLFAGTHKDNQNDRKMKNKLKTKVPKKESLPRDLKKSDYLSLEEILILYPFTLPMIRRYLLNRKKNGLYKACYKIANRLIIKKDLFDEWITKNGENL